MYEYILILFFCDVAFGFPKFESKSNRANSGPEELAKRFGFYCQSHQVITEDDYILTVHRIKSVKVKAKPSGVALLLPGFLASSETWLFRGSDKDLPYVFANSGYDVWICNPRGNYFSRRHKTLDPDRDFRFWNFSIHEHGVYDLPAVIDYALNVTKEDSVYFFGHSIGAAAFFIMCAEKPQYNAKIKLANALAPVAVVTQPVSSFARFLLSLIPPLMKFFKFNGVYEMFPRGHVFPTLGRALCRNGAFTQSLCLSLIFAVVGTINDQFNRTMLPEALGYYPAGTSVDVFNHLYHIFVTKRFGPLRADTEYKLEMVTAPVVLHYGEGDALVSEMDNEILSKRLPNVVNNLKVPYKNFNHIDFMWSIDSKILLYDHLVSLMKRYQ